MIYSEPQARSLPHFCRCCLWPWLHLPSEGKGKFGGFSFLLANEQCIVQHRICDPYNNGWTDRDAVWDDEWAWPEEQRVTWSLTIPEGKQAILGETFPTSLTPLWITNWTGSCSGVYTIGADAWLQALDESIIGPGTKSDIYDCLVCSFDANNHRAGKRWHFDIQE